MLTIKKRGLPLLAVVVACLSLTACGPPGVRAMHRGDRQIQETNYSDAIASLTEAVALMTNQPAPVRATAFNLLGLAYHKSGDGPAAQRCYLAALQLDRNLAAADFNLGCLELASSNYAPAANALTSYTEMEKWNVDGFLKLGAAHLHLAQQTTLAQERARELANARKDYETAQRLSRTLEAGNNLGVIDLLENPRPTAAVVSNAMFHFNLALAADPKYSPALLNTAVVYDKYLNDPLKAITNYGKYLELNPASPFSKDVDALTNSLDHWRRFTYGGAGVSGTSPSGSSDSSPGSLTFTPVHPPTAAGSSNTPARGPTAASNTVPAGTRASPSSPTPGPTSPPTSAPPPTRSSPSGSIPSNQTPPVIVPSPEVVRIEPTPAAPTRTDPPPATTPELAPTPAPRVSETAPPAPIRTPEPPAPEMASGGGGAVAIPATNESGNGAASNASGRPSVLSRINPLTWFAGSSRGAAGGRGEGSGAGGVTPLPEPAGSSEHFVPTEIAMYEGNREQATRLRAQGAAAEKESRLKDAKADYQDAVKADPSDYQASMALGLVCIKTGDYSAALDALHHAITLQPDSSDARYAYAWSLSKREYYQDAANELEKLLAKFPNEVRAHLLVGNLYAQQLGQPDLARGHYQRVLAADPHNAQAAAIQTWLQNNPAR